MLSILLASGNQVLSKIDNPLLGVSSVVKHTAKTDGNAGVWGKPGVGGAVATNVSIRFGKNYNQVYHTFRKTDALGLDRKLVQSSIQEHFNTVSSQVIIGKPFNQIIEIGGKKLQYTAYKLCDGKFNIGRIHEVK